ncbi:hypothetical protein AGMMS50230_09460 [Spirochaetia bacterium]|nr:hypothetical protein AGMMS50230_09460 [Spirochaetia bacterium]
MLVTNGLGHGKEKSWLRLEGEQAFIGIKAVPGASKTALAGIKDGRLRIRLAAAPEGGKANAELTAFLAKMLSCAKKDIVLYLGERSRLKTVILPAKSAKKLEKMLVLGKNMV